MLELLIVVALIIVMAAVALPNIVGYVRQSKVRSATQQVAGEIQTARNKAIVKNVNVSNNAGTTGGVVFAIVDENSYRFSVIDDNFAVIPADPTLGLAPLRDLPQGVTFVPGANLPVFGIGFDQLGRRCALLDPGNPAYQAPCAGPQTQASMCADGDARCTDRAGGNFLEGDPLNPTNIRVRVRETTTGIERFIRIEAGGRVMAQR
jgi:hypothetical protein